jgi:hypothetical protein
LFYLFPFLGNIREVFRRGGEGIEQNMERKSCLSMAFYLRECASRRHTVGELRRAQQERIIERDYWLELFECKEKKLAAELGHLHEWNKNDMLLELYEMLLNTPNPNEHPKMFIQCARRFEIMAETY